MYRKVNSPFAKHGASGLKRRRQEIERLHDRVSEHLPAARAAFLAGACGGDEELLRGVEPVAQDVPQAVTLDQSTWAGAVPPVTVVGPGTQLGPYRIEALNRQRNESSELRH